MRKIRFIAIILMLSLSIGLLCNYTLAEEQNEIETDIFADLAFPAAEGYGRFSNGFRGGKVVKVTNLNGYGEGSLRWALEEVSGPRIVVFEVGGVIDLDNDYETVPTHLTIKEGNVYIAGQTAPGDGITIVGEGLYIKKAENVVVRDIRFRVGEPTGMSLEAVSINNSENIIIDHCSMSWACGGIGVENSKNITVQNCIVSESHTYQGLLEWYLEWPCSGIVLDVENGSFYRNLISNMTNKIWGFSYDSSSEKGENNNNIDIRNNVVYNWYAEASGVESKSTQFVNNYYKKGEDTKNETLLTLNGTGYVLGNKLVDNTGTVIVDSDNENPWIIASEDSFPDGRSNEALFEAGVNTLTADEAYEYVLENAGATVPARDYIDERYISEVANGTHTYASGSLAGIIYTQNDAEGLPNNDTFVGGEVLADADNDGMPDEWEVLHGLNPENYYDACQVYLSDEGYTNIELYINELAGDPVKYSDNPTVQYNPATPTPEPTATPEITATPEVSATPEITMTPEVTETIVPASTPDVPDYLIGDVDFDGKVNATDALLLLKHAAKIEILSDDKLIIADVEPDEKIDAADALAILKIAAKIE